MQVLLQKDDFGNMHLELPNGEVSQHVKIIRAFPISQPDSGFSIVSADGHELVWLESLQDLSAAHQVIAKSALEETEFIPVIHAITDLNSYALPSVWKIATDRGATNLKLNSEQDIRRVSNEALLITDANGIQYLIKNRKTLDKFSKKVLDRFM